MITVNNIAIRYSFHRSVWWYPWDSSGIAVKWKIPAPWRINHFKGKCSIVESTKS